MKKLIYILLTVVLVASCSKKDDNPATSPCISGLTLSVQEITTNTAQLYWDFSTGDSNWDFSTMERFSFVVEYGMEGFAPGTGTVVENIQANVLDLSNLLANTSYSFYVKARCDDEFSETVGPKIFTTLECPTIDTRGVMDITENSAQFKWYGTSTVEIEYGLEGFNIGSGTTVQILSGTNRYTLENLTPSTTYDIYIRNICNSDFSEYSSVVRFTTLESCKTPTNFHLIGVGKYFVRVGWDKNGESSWQIEYGRVGFRLGNGTKINTSDSTPLIQNGIDSNTTYEFYVRANCGSKGYSKYAGPLVVATE